MTRVPREDRRLVDLYRGPTGVRPDEVVAYSKPDGDPRVIQQIRRYVWYGEPINGEREAAQEYVGWESASFTRSRTKAALLDMKYALQRLFGWTYGYLYPPSCSHPDVRPHRYRMGDMDSYQLVRSSPQTETEFWKDAFLQGGFGVGCDWAVFWVCHKCDRVLKGAFYSIEAFAEDTDSEKFQAALEGRRSLKGA